MNPVLLNDLRKSLLRRKPVHAVAAAAGAIVVLTKLIDWLFPSGQLYGHLSGVALWYFPDIVLPVVVPAFACTAFAREHEQRTWQDVLLTRLSTGEILSGKVLSCLIPVLTTVAVLFPPYMLILIISGATLDSNAPAIDAVFTRLLAMSCFYVALALVCSYHSPNPRVAIAITYTVLAFVLIMHWVARPLLAMLALAYTPSGYGGAPYSSSGYSTYYYGSGSYGPYAMRQMLQSASITESLCFAPILLTHLAVRIRRARA